MVRWRGADAVRLNVMMIVLVLPWTCAELASAQVQSSYAIFDVGDLGNPHQVNCRAITSAGMATGYSWYLPGFNASTHTYKWKNGVLTDIGGGLGCCSTAYDINENEEVAGRSGNNGKPTLWKSDNTPTFPAGFDPTVQVLIGGLNDLDEIVGQTFFTEDSEYPVPFLWQNGVLTNLGTLGGKTGHAVDVNNFGVVAGVAGVADSLERAFRWEKGVMTELPGISEEVAFDAAWDINDIGEIVGSVYDEHTFSYHATRWSANNSPEILEQDAEASDSNAVGTNDRSDVVGILRISGESEGCLWTAEGEEILLTPLLPPNHGWTLEHAWDINDVGMICGEGEHVPYTGDTFTRGFVMVPVTQTLDLTPPSPGYAGTRNVISVRNAMPGHTITFIYGKRGGGSVIPGCDLASTLAAIQIDNAKVIGTATANAQGIAKLVANVPGAARSAGVLLIQAYDAADCAISDLVQEEFE